jgi:fused signal recognition particle receptor
MNEKFSKPASFLGKIRDFFTGGNVKEYIDDIEAALIEADIDMSIVGHMVEMLKKEKLRTFEDAKEFLKSEFEAKLTGGPQAMMDSSLHVIILAGINGGGKTTAAAKLANMFKKAGKKTLLVAADTFRAAAIEQLEEWGRRIGVEVVRGAENSDPASVVYDGLSIAKKQNTDVLIIDTAGRLHTKLNLMQEIIKIRRLIGKEVKDENVDSFIIVDANIGKNAYVQAKEFHDAIKLTGVVLTKFDSSAKGGSIIHIRSDLNLPVRYITFGESLENIEEFNPRKFVEELFG